MRRDWSAAWQAHELEVVSPLLTTGKRSVRQAGSECANVALF
jgi:hypothetical protein